MTDWTLYAEAIQSEFIDMVKGDLRFSGSEELAPFWNNPPEPGNDDITTRFDASVAFRVTNNLLRIGESDFVGQIEV